MENVLVALLLHAPIKQGSNREDIINVESCRLLIRRYRTNYYLAWKAYGFLETLRAN